jgi:hypothetical protein
MGDVGDDFRAWKDHRKARKKQFGTPCPSCQVKLPKAQAKILMPGQRCWCGYVDPRSMKKAANVTMPDHVEDFLDF